MLILQLFTVPAVYPCYSTGYSFPASANLNIRASFAAFSSWYLFMIEINESCPNVKHQSDDGLEERLMAVKDAKGNTPVFVKLGTLGDPRAEPG